MLTVVLCTILFGAACSSGEGVQDKAYVVDGALALASRQLYDKRTILAPVSETFTQHFGPVNILFTLQLSEGTLEVEELSRQGDIGYLESPAGSKFQFHALLRTKVECEYALYGGGSTVSSGNAVIHWDMTLNGSLVTEACNLALGSEPRFDSELFHVDFYSDNKSMNVSYNDYRFNSITTVYLQKVSVLTERSLGSVPICEAIPC